MPLPLPSTPAQLAPYVQQVEQGSDGDPNLPPSVKVYPRLPDPKPPGVGFMPYAALALGNLADAYTSDKVVSQPGGYEANPMIPTNNPVAIDALKTLYTGLTAAGMHKLAASGHPTAAKVIGYLSGAGYGVLALHNNSLIKK